MENSRVVWVGLLTFLVVLGGCSEPKTVEVPAPVPVEQLYQELVNGKEVNETFSNAYVKSRPVLSFEGQVTEIDGNKVQFHISKRDRERDKYVECRFDRKSDVFPLGEGQASRVYGFLDDVGRVVKLKNCGLYDRLP